jgi:hypothetical protein
LREVACTINHNWFGGFLLKAVTVFDVISLEIITILQVNPDERERARK